VIKDITDGIVAALLEAFPGVKIYTERIRQGLTEPCFILRLVTPASVRTLGERFKRTHLFSVRYIPESPTASLYECYGITDTLFGALEYIAVRGDVIRGSGMRSEHTDDGVTFLVNYNVFVRPETEKIPMETLDVEMRGNKNG
jgi:hypothetical protein